MHQQWIAHRIKYGTVTNPPPPKVPWHIVHAACHEAPAAGRVYVLPLSKLRTYRQIIDAMLRMSWEHWLADTEHQALIRTILDARR